MRKVVKRWPWRDKKGKCHWCIELSDGSKYVLEKRGRKVVPRPIGPEGEIVVEAR
ncbi:MAG: hypothetical protein JRD89_18880 [Deltaproteobacteria bacterium]|nr:hypothetical protein [Deltaproteobacteria bacterium]